MDLAPWLAKGSRQLLRLRTILGHAATKREYTPRALAILFLIATLLGAGIKSVANDRLTIGYDDYRLTSRAGTLDLNLLEKELIRTSTSSTERSVAPQGESCAEAVTE